MSSRTSYDSDNTFSETSRQSDTSRQSGTSRGKGRIKTPEQREKLRAANRRSKLRMLEKETPEQKEQRLAKERERRRNETPEEREIRLAKDRQYRIDKRRNETLEEREIRLSKIRDQRLRRIHNETPEQREKRIAKYREWKNGKIQNETPEEREIRLALTHEYYVRSRLKKGKPTGRFLRKGTPEQKERPHEKNNECHSRKRKNEKVEKRETRPVRECRTRSRRQETQQSPQPLTVEDSDTSGNNCAEQSQIVVKTEYEVFEIFEQEEPQFTEATIAPDVPAEVTTYQNEEQLFYEQPFNACQEIIETLEQTELKYLPKNHQTISGKAESEVENIPFYIKSEEIDSPIIMQSQANTSTLEAGQNIKQEPSSWI